MRTCLLIKKTMIFLLFAVFISTTAWAADIDAVKVKAEKGDVEAQLELGLIYVQGTDVDQDFTAAKKWWDKAAAQGNATARYYVGLMYARGDGVTQDVDQARAMWEQSADMDHVGALFSLGMLYVEGEAVKGDYAEAGKYFIRAAELGNVQSQFNVSMLYSQGLGFPQSHENSYAWAKLASDQGHPNAKELLTTLETQMSEEQMVIAKAEYEKVKTSLTK
jgi:uncharacterized protein